jgi:large subunit ribosomal protein L31
VKEGIHPNYELTTVVCSCGNRYETRSTAGGELHVELCNQCHPFFTGQQKFVDTGGRVQRFSDKFGNAATAVLEKEAAEKEARRKASEEAAAKLKQERDAKAAEKAAKAEQFDQKAAKDARREAAVADAAAAAEEAAADASVDEPAVEAEVADAEAPAVEQAPAEESAE